MSNSAEYAALCRPAAQALEAKWAAEKAAEAARAARAEAHPWHGADSLLEALGDWD